MNSYSYLEGFSAQNDLKSELYTKYV